MWGGCKRDLQTSRVPAGRGGLGLTPLHRVCWLVAGPKAGCFAQVGSLGCLGPGEGVPRGWGEQLWVRVPVEWGSEPLVTQGRGGVCRERRGVSGPSIWVGCDQVLNAGGICGSCGLSERLRPQLFTLLLPQMTSLCPLLTFALCHCPGPCAWVRRSLPRSPLTKLCFCPPLSALARPCLGFCHEVLESLGPTQGRVRDRPRAWARQAAGGDPGFL